MGVYVGVPAGAEDGRPRRRTVDARSYLRETEQSPAFRGSARREQGNGVRRRAKRGALLRRVRLVGRLFGTINRLRDVSEAKAAPFRVERAQSEALGRLSARRFGGATAQSVRNLVGNRPRTRVQAGRRVDFAGWQALNRRKLGRIDRDGRQILSRIEVFANFDPVAREILGRATQTAGVRNRKSGEARGRYYPNNRNQRAVRYILFDANYWKTFVYRRILTSVGDSGSLEIFGNDVREHELLARRLSSEIWTPTNGCDRVVNVRTSRRTRKGSAGSTESSAPPSPRTSWARPDPNFTPRTTERIERFPSPKRAKPPSKRKRSRDANPPPNRRRPTARNPITAGRSASPTRREKPRAGGFERAQSSLRRDVLWAVKDFKNDSFFLRLFSG